MLTSFISLSGSCFHEKDWILWREQLLLEGDKGHATTYMFSWRKILQELMSSCEESDWSEENLVVSWRQKMNSFEELSSEILKEKRRQGKFSKTWLDLSFFPSEKMMQKEIQRRMKIAAIDFPHFKIL